MPSSFQIESGPSVCSSVKRGSTLGTLIAAVAGGSAVVFAVLSLASVPRSSPIAMSRPTPATNAEVGATLHRLGLSPERLAAAGVSSQQTSALIGNLRGYLETNVDSLRAADSGYSASSMLVDSLERTVRAGTATQQEREALTTARSLLASQALSRQALLDAAFTAATAGLESRIVQSLTLAAIGARWDLPLEYAFTERNEADWVQLRDALSDRRINTKYGLEPSQDALNFIAAADGVPAVSTAHANLETSLAAVSAAWNLAVNQ